jgi:hypothetical protein
MTTQGNVPPVPDHDQAARPGGRGGPKRVTKAQPRQVAPAATKTGAGQGQPRNRPRYSGGR